MSIVNNIKAKRYKLPGTSLKSQFPLINAVIEKKQPGHIIINNKNNPSVVFVINNSGFAQVLKADTKDDILSIAEYIAAVDTVPEYFHIYDYPAGLDGAFLEEGLKLKSRLRIKFRYVGAASSKDQIYLTENINYSNIDLLSENGLDKYKNFWRSESEFLKNGYGSICMTEAGVPVSVCYSACVADKTSEIDIATSAEYHNKGYAYTACLHFIGLSKERNIIPSWDCFSDNHASIALAKKIGFIPESEYRFLSVFNESKSHN